MELTKEEIQYLLTAVDAHVRATGLNSAANALVVATKLQNQAKALTDAEAPKGDNGAE